MKIGLLSDIHANRPALEAVLEDMPTVDLLVCLGDVVGYNPFPSECVEMVRHECDVVLQGNHDREIRNPERYDNNKQARAGLTYAQRELQDEQIEYLLALPAHQEIGEFLAVHSHPANLDEYVFPKDFPKMRPYLDDHDGIFLGHTHLQHEAVIDDRLIVNPGSVGQPRDGTAARYAVVDADTHEISVYGTEYAIQEVTREIKRTGLPDATAERLTPGDRGRRRDRNPWR